MSKWVSGSSVCGDELMLRLPRSNDRFMLLHHSLVCWTILRDYGRCLEDRQSSRWRTLGLEPLEMRDERIFYARLGGCRP